jgi:GTP cyclohydrolase IIa
MALVQLDDYGPWTTTPEPRRETDLQALQARLFADVADFFGDRDGYAFAGRHDNMVGVATEIEPAAFARLQERVRNRYPVTVSVGVGTAATPAGALDAAGAVLREAGSAQSADRREVRGHRTGPDVTETTTPGPVTVAHFDLVDATGRYTDRVSPTRAELVVRRAVLALADHLHERHEAVTQFVGGDNAIAVCPPLDRDDLDDATAHVREATDVELQVGVGRGPTAHAAGDDAKHALERCRETGDRIRIRGSPEPADD